MFIFFAPHTNTHCASRKQTHQVTPPHPEINNNNNHHHHHHHQMTAHMHIIIISIILTLLFVTCGAVSTCNTDGDCFLGTSGTDSCMTTVCNRAIGHCTSPIEKNCTLNRCARNAVENECATACYDICPEWCNMLEEIERQWTWPVPLPRQQTCSLCSGLLVSGVGTACELCLSTYISDCVQKSVCHGDHCVAGVCKSVDSVLGEGVPCIVDEYGNPVHVATTTLRSPIDHVAELQYEEDEERCHPGNRCMIEAYVGGRVVQRPIQCPSSDPCVIGQCRFGHCRYEAVDCDAMCPGTHCVACDGDHRCVGRRTECAEYVCDAESGHQHPRSIREGMPCEDGTGYCHRGTCISRPILLPPPPLPPSQPYHGRVFGTGAMIVFVISLFGLCLLGCVLIVQDARHRRGHGRNY